jgi:3-isopropylmalate/(R)-2-methylmalate dehydratase large subunit
VKLDQVVIGSCTNGRIEDMRIAAEITEKQEGASGRQVHYTSRNAEIWKMAMNEGTLDIFIEAAP